MRQMAGMEVDDGPARAGSKRNFSRSGPPGAGGRLSNQVCHYWQEGRCNKGDDCQYLHPGSPGTTGRGAGNGVANKRSNNFSGGDGGGAGFANGTAAGGGFSTGSGGRRNVSARWGRPRGNKSGGGRGGFHQTQRKPRDKLCSYWIKGDCIKGNQCNYLHAHTTAPDITMMTMLSGHEKAVRAIALPAGSSQLYTGGQDETVRVWDCTTGQCASVVPMGGDVGALLSESGWLFVGLPNEVKAWNMQTSTQQSLSGPIGQVHALAVSNDVLFAGTHDGSILAWKFNASTNSFEPAASFAGHTGPVITLQVAAGRLYSGSMDKCIRVWDLATGACLQNFQAHSNVVMGLLCWEQFLLSCSLDGTVKVWAANSSGSLEVTYTHPEEEGQVDVRDGALSLCGTIDLDGKPVLLCSYNDNTVRLFDLPSFNERGSLFSREEVRALQVGPGGLLFSGDSHGAVKVWRWQKAE